MIIDCLLRLIPHVFLKNNPDFHLGKINFHQYWRKKKKKTFSFLKICKEKSNSPGTFRRCLRLQKDPDLV